jgi:hypothetical protein
MRKSLLVITNLICIFLLGLTAGILNAQPSQVVSSVSDITGDLHTSPPYPTYTRTFSYTIPSNSEITGAILSGTWGNDFFEFSTAGVDIKIEGYLAAQCTYGDPGCWAHGEPLRPWSSDLPPTIFPQIADGSALLTVEQTSPKYVELGYLTLTIFYQLPPPVITLDPTTLHFEYSTGSVLPAEQSVSLTSSGPPLDYSVAVATDSGGDWLAVSETNGTTPGSVAVAVDPVGLSASETPYTGTVTVTSAGAANSPQMASVHLTVRGFQNPEPDIDSINPAEVPAGGSGFHLQVHGSNFLSGTKVKWNGIEMQSVTFLSSRQLRAEVPESFLASPGNVEITVYTPEPGGGETDPAIFTIGTPYPVISALSLQSTIAGRPGYQVGIYGSNFLPESTAEWNGAARATVFFSSRQLVIQIEQQDIDTPGTGIITALNPEAKRSNGADLQILDLPPAAPEIRRLIPDTIPAAGAFTLAVEGSGYVPGSTVLWNGSEKITHYESEYRLTAEIEEGDIGTQDIYYVTVRNPEAEALKYHYQARDAGNDPSNTAPISKPAAEPRITGFSPAAVPAGNPAFTLTIRGWGYIDGNTTVTWNNSALQAAFVSDKQLTVEIPADYVAQEGTAAVGVNNSSPGGGAHKKTFPIIAAEASAAALLYPRLVNVGGEPDETEATGIAVANLSEAETILTAWAYEQAGDEIQGTEITNPVSVTVSPKEKMAIVDWEVFGASFEDENGDGWLKLEGTENQMTGFFMMFNDSLTYLDGANAQTEGMEEFIFSEIEIENDGFTEIHVANPNEETVSVTFELRDADGQTKGTTAQRQLAGNAILKEMLDDLFSQVVPEEGDYVCAAADAKVAPFEYMGRKPNYVYGLNGHPVESGSTVLYAPQYATGGGVYRTTLSVVNLDETDGWVTLRLLGDDGVQVGETRSLHIEGKGKLRVTDQDFFAEAGEELLEGYVEITSDGAPLAGNVVFGDPEREQFASSLPLVSDLLEEMTFGHVVTDEIYWTGIAVLNPGQLEAGIIIRLYDELGNLIRIKQEIIPPGHRTIGLLTEYFPGLVESGFSQGYLRITASCGVASFALFGHGLTFLSAIPPQVLPEY